MFLAGLELHLNELVQNKKASALGGVFGVALPILFGFLIGSYYEYGIEQCHVFRPDTRSNQRQYQRTDTNRIKALRSRVGLGLLGAAVIDDMLVILVLSTFLALQSGGNAIQIIFVFLKMVAFLAGSVGFGLWILPRISRYVSRLPISQGLVTLALIVMLVYGVSAELFGGMAAITGAFIAGLMFSRTEKKLKSNAVCVQ